MITNMVLIEGLCYLTPKGMKSKPKSKNGINQYVGSLSIRHYTVRQKIKRIECLVLQHKQLLVHKKTQDGAQRDKVFGSKNEHIT